MFNLLERDLLGNHFPYQSLRNWLLTENKDDSNKYSMRFGLELGAPFKYDLSFDEVLIEQNRTKDLYSQDQIMIVTMPRDIEPMLQGEFTISEIGHYLHCSEYKAVMRIALQNNSKHYLGLSAKLVLEKFLDPASVEDIYTLARNYENAVIEFSCYDENVGVFPHRNTVIWEVRNY